MLVTPRRSLRMAMPASAARSQRKPRDLEHAARNGSTQDHHSVQIRIHVSFAVDSLVCIIVMIHTCLKANSNGWKRRVMESNAKLEKSERCGQAHSVNRRERPPLHTRRTRTSAT